MNKRIEVYSIVRVLIVICLGFAVGGCCTGICREGYERGSEYRNRQTRVYRLVAALNAMERSDRNEFLRGFKTAYRAAGDARRGEEYAKILKGAVESGTYGHSFAQGQGHVDGRVTDAQIQTMIRKSFGQNRGFALAWRAGYIEGFVDEMSKRDARYGEEGLYDQAEKMYHALSPVQTRKVGLGTVSKSDAPWLGAVLESQITY
ncbi:MAG: hypothetical protein ACYSWQ_02255 [Planctomycetota bacterium]|jgi:hypothetical protein